jgi:hypothetical protein
VPISPLAPRVRFTRPGRKVAGEWVCLDAVTYVEPHAVGLAESRVFDERGPIGRAAQSLLIERAG